jgi:polyhydroxybutyrate depolymerase
VLAPVVSRIVLVLTIQAAMVPLQAAAAPPEARGGLTDRLPPGNHRVRLVVDGRRRSYLVHVPPQVAGATADAPLPVVLALHGAAMNGWLMRHFTGLDGTADRAGFIAVYPDGTGPGPFLVWNAGHFPGNVWRKRPNDVAFLEAVIDDLATRAPVDPARICACGFSNGGMMCYRLAAERSQRIAAIAPVAGTIAMRDPAPVRPVPVLHFHGTRDRFVPYTREAGGLGGRWTERLRDVPGTIAEWVRLAACTDPAVTDVLADGARDGLRVTRERHGGCADGAEVVLVTIEGGGHTWPGRRPPVWFIGRSTRTVSANELMWEFFTRHPLR